LRTVISQRSAEQPDQSETSIYVLQTLFGEAGLRYSANLAGRRDVPVGLELAKHLVSDVQTRSSIR
jgi:hypothetical protein